MSKSNWEGTFRNLREQYIRGAERRLENIAQSLEKLRQSPEDVAALQDLKRHFHGLSGSGTTYGYPRVSAIGLEGDRSCQSLLKASTSPKPEDLKRWQELLDELQEQFTQTQPVPAAPDQFSMQISKKGSRIFIVDDDADVA